MSLRERFQRWNRARSQDAYEKQIPPAFFHIPSFPQLTNHQRNLLIKLVELTIEQGLYLGEFWWWDDPYADDRYRDIVIQIKPRTRDGDFDPDNQLFKGTKWTVVVEKANMLALDKFGYLVMSEPREYGSKKEKWRHLSVTSQGFKFSEHIQKSLLLRFIRHVWEKAENHTLALVFGFLGALLVEAIRYLVDLFPQ